MEFVKEKEGSSCKNNVWGEGQVAMEIEKARRRELNPTFPRVLIWGD